MKKNFNIMIDIREKKKYWLLIVTLVLIFTTFNNYYFYTYVEYAVKKDAKQLELILNEDLKYFRANKISGTRYRGHTRVIIKQFAKKAQYNKSITLNYQNAILKRTGEFKKGYEPWETKKDYEKVAQSTIKIIIPKLNSKEKLKYSAKVKEVNFLNGTFYYSIFRSMTLSLTDVIGDIQEKDFSNVWNKWKLKYLPRSRNPAIFLVVLWVLFWRIRKYQIELYKKNSELTTENSELTTEIVRLETELEGDGNQDIKKIMKYIKSREIKKLELLIKNGIDIDTKDSAGMTALMLYMLTGETEKEKREIIKIFLNHGANINSRNNAGMTTLMLCTLKNDIGTVKILLENMADTTIKQEISVVDIAASDIKKLLSKAKNNNAPELVKLLTNFRKDAPLKYTTHDWDDEKFKYDWSNQYGDFKGYLSRVKEQWETMDEDLKKLSPILHTKIYNFLINDKNDYDSWCSRDGDMINVGWSSLQGLEQWVNDGNDPFDFETKNYKIDGQTINCFGDIITIFKREIQVRTGELKCIREKNMLKSIFKNTNKNFNLSLDFTDLKENQFYTDLATFKSVLNILFKQFSEESEYKTIKIESSVESEDKYYILKVIQVGSFRDESSQKMLNIVEGGDFSKIKNNLSNLCDWSVESKNTKGSYRINYLRSDDRDEIETTNVSPIGYTHIFRFYK